MNEEQRARADRQDAAADEDAELDAIEIPEEANPGDVCVFLINTVKETPANANDLQEPPEERNKDAASDRLENLLEEHEFSNE